MTPNDLVFVTLFISESLRCSGREISTLFVLRGWPIIMYSVFSGFALSLFIRIHSEMFLNSVWAFVSRTSILLEINVTCVSSYTC